MCKVTTSIGILRQLESMLTNHPERQSWELEAKLKGYKNNDIDCATIQIYANEPESKIYEKIEKLRLKGGMTTLRILKLSVVKDADVRKVYLELKI